MKVRYELQGSAEWFDSRLGKVTGTALKDIMGTASAREGAFHEILSERLTPHVDMEHLHENPMSRGMRLENEAVLAFEYVTGKKTERCGLCESDENPNIAYSPDAIVSETEDVEVKCPEGKNYLRIVNGKRVPKEYHWQIVQGFIVNPKLETRWFVAYNPDIPSHPIHIIKCTRPEYADDIAKAGEEQSRFLAEVEEKLKSITNQ